MVVGTMNSSPSEMVGNSSGHAAGRQARRASPPSATSRRCTLQLFSSLQELQMPMTGLPSNTSAGIAFRAQPGAAGHAVVFGSLKPLAAAEILHESPPILLPNL